MDSALRRAWGGRLRTYRPKLADGESRLHAIRKALVRGELVLNGFNRWQLQPITRHATEWTFVETGRTEEVAKTEIGIAQRETDSLRILSVNESTAESVTMQLEKEGVRADLLVAQRDWGRHPDPCPAFRRTIESARRRGLVIHIIAAFGTNASDDELYREARDRRRLVQEPSHRPRPQSSKIERRFGEMLTEAGFKLVPQRPVAHYFLDFAIIGQADGLPVRLDIEVDGRYWHEELPNRYRLKDEYRDRILRCLGWRPVRFWADEIELDEAGSIERIRGEAGSATPLTSRNATKED